MEDYSKLTPQQLEEMDTQALIAIILSLQGQLDTISSQLEVLTEQFTLMNQRSRGSNPQKGR